MHLDFRISKSLAICCAGTLPNSFDEINPDFRRQHHLCLRILHAKKAPLNTVSRQIEWSPMGRLRLKSLKTLGKLGGLAYRLRFETCYLVRVIGQASDQKLFGASLIKVNADREDKRKKYDEARARTLRP